MDSDLEALFEERRKINEKINKFVLDKYKKYEGMKSDVKDDNPYR